MSSRGHLSLLACASGRAFAERIAAALRQIYDDEPNLEPFSFKRSTEVVFPNGEIKTVIEENIRGQDVYVVQCIDDPLAPERTVNDNLVALLGALDAAYRSDADSVTAVLPQFPYSRQERKKARECITAQLVARFLEDAGARKVITIDIHAEAIEGFFQRATVENLHASRSIMEGFRTRYPVENLVAVAPDVGSADRARYYSKGFDCGLAIVDKVRGASGKVESMRLVGDVRGRDVFIGDDLIATGGTMINAMGLLKDEGARDIYVACTLPFFNEDAAERFDRAYEEGLFRTVIGTDAVFRGEAFQVEHPWYGEVSVAPLFAQVILNINRKGSVSALLK